MACLEVKALALIQSIKAHPELYNANDPRFHRFNRAERQRLWDYIAKNSGYIKTEDAKYRWRSLLTHFRDHFDNVSKKKLRRYIPRTDNPEDKYVQKDDWSYYKYMQFMEPHIKEKQGTSFKSLSPKNVSKTTKVTKVNSSITHTPVVASITVEKQMPMHLQIGNVLVEVEVNAKKDIPFMGVENNNSNLQTANNSYRIVNEALSIHDQNLKTFFDSMLQFTKELPKFHQERIKKKLENVINK